MTLLYTSDLFLEHRTGFGHPERPERLSTCLAHLKAVGLMNRVARCEFEPLAPTDIKAVHTCEHIEQVRSFADRGGGRIEADTVVSPKSCDAALLAAGAGAAAVDAVIAGPDRRALCLVRPPGHHAVRDRPMGFCLFNNIAIAAQRAISKHGIDRVLIVDFDVHHGNGTQDIFYSDPRVMFFSIHRYPFYPGTGAADETGTGRGLGFTWNEPVAFGTPRDAYRARFEKSLAACADKIRPQLVLISAGFDAHAADPIGSLGLEVEDFAWLTRAVLDVAETHAAGRVVSLLEGGYNVEMLARSVEAHLRELLDESA